MRTIRKSAIFFALAGILIASSSAQAATEYVYDFGVGNWYSWDTRNTSGTGLNGTNDTSPSINSYYLARSIGSPSSADDTAISRQIVFMGEGQTVNDAAGNTPPASPAGSLGGLGYVRLDGTSSNSGKSDISYVNTSGIAATSSLNTASFGLSYRFFAQSNATSREPGLNIGVTGTDSDVYIFAFVLPIYTANDWNMASVDQSTGAFTIYHSGIGTLEGGAAKTLADWAADATYGSILFGPTSEIYRIGFNIGSSQKDGLDYLDWMETNLLNGGGVIDFVGSAPAATPDGGTTIMLLGSALTGLAAFGWRTKKS